MHLLPQLQLLLLELGFFSAMHNMQQFIFSVLLHSLLLRLTLAAPACTDGQIETRGPYFYQCQAGSLQPAGCVVLSGTQQVRIGETYLHDGYEYQCILDSDGVIWEKIVACWYEQHRIAESELYQNKKHWYECRREGNTLRLQVSGCVVAGRRLQPSERYSDATLGVLFECRKEPDDAIAICSIGCVVNGREYLIGEQYIDSGKVKRCSKNGRICAAVLVGCADSDGKVYKDSETMLSSDGAAVMRCDMQADDISWTPIGCIRAGDAQPNSMPLNSQWREGAAPNQYLVECSQLGGKAVKVQTRCVYSAGSETLEINPGCIRKANSDPSLAVGCQQTSSTALQIVTFASDRADLAVSYNLRTGC